MAIRYSPAPEVKAIADELIAAHHRHLTDVKVEYVFRSKTQMRGEMEIWGTARKVSDLNAFLAAAPDAETGEWDDQEQEDSGTPFFCVVIAKPRWEKLEQHQRRALVDHELSHCFAEKATNDDGEIITRLSLVPHDLEEFVSIVDRHGLYREGVQKFAEACDVGGDQLALPILLHEHENELLDELREHVNRLVANSGLPVRATFIPAAREVRNPRPDVTVVLGSNLRGTLRRAVETALTPDSGKLAAAGAN